MSPADRHAAPTLTRLADGLHVVSHFWGRSPMGRRMTVLTTPGGRTLIHSAVKLEGEQLQRLEALGEIAWILVPNGFHASEAAFYADAHPDALVLVPKATRARLKPAWGRIDGSPESDWPEELTGVIDRHPLAGLRMDEVLLHHLPSRTLVLTDLCFNLAPEDLAAPARFVVWLNGVLGRLGPSRLFRAAAVRDAAELGRALLPVLELDFDRVVLSHGRVLETGGKEALREALRIFTERV